VRHHHLLGLFYCGRQVLAAVSRHQLLLEVQHQHLQHMLTPAHS
jgi:hypothetical protein